VACDQEADPIIPIDASALRAIASNLVDPVGQATVEATLTDEMGEPVMTGPTTLVTGNIQHVELSDEVTEDDCAVAGHGANSMKRTPEINVA
jgi:hypothetical protein